MGAKSVSHCQVRPAKQQELYLKMGGSWRPNGPRLTKGTEYCGLNEVFSNIAIAY